MVHTTAEPASPTPVFNDPTGRRATVVRRLSWGLCALFAAVVATVGVTLMAQVPLPGLGGLLPGPDDRPAQPRATTSQQERSTTDDVTVAEPEAGIRQVTVRTALRDTSAKGQGRTSKRSPAKADSGTAAGTPVAPSVAGSASPAAPSAPQTPAAKTRNPKAAPKKPSPAAGHQPNEHAAAGKPVRTTDGLVGTAGAPGRNK